MAALICSSSNASSNAVQAEKKHRQGGAFFVARLGGACTPYPNTLLLTLFYAVNFCFRRLRANYRLSRWQKLTIPRVADNLYCSSFGCHTNPFL